MKREIKLGELLSSHEERDAVHIAVAPVIANETLQPGQHVGFVDEGEHPMVGPNARYMLGVVDPFLKDSLSRGNRFWLFLYPNTISSLRHEWEHPLFTKDMAPSKKWMMEFALGLDYGSSVFTWEELVQAGTDYIDHGEFLVADNESFREGFQEEFWEHWQVLTGRLAPEELRENFFSCSC